MVRVGPSSQAIRGRKGSRPGRRKEGRWLLPLFDAMARPSMRSISSFGRVVHGEGRAAMRHRMLSYYRREVAPITARDRHSA